MGADDVHGALFSTMMLHRWYKVTVNESETITVAKPACCGPKGLSFGPRAGPHVERS
jgi:hypothetical protein